MNQYLYVWQDYFVEKSIPPSNIISVTADGASAIFERSFINLLKRKVLKLFVIYCVIHRQYLVAKNLSARMHRLYNSLVNLRSYSR